VKLVVLGDVLPNLSTKGLAGVPAKPGAKRE